MIRRAIRKLRAGSAPHTVGLYLDADLDFAQPRD